MTHCSVKAFTVERFGRHMFKMCLVFGGVVILVNISGFITPFTVRFQQKLTVQTKDEGDFGARSADETETSLHQINMIVPNGNACRRSPEDPLFVIIVFSKVQNSVQRRLIRRTWGEGSLLNRFRAVLLFALAAPQLASQQNAVLRENSVYDDIIQVDCTESYENLTYKSIGAIGWVSQHCKNAKIFMKIDDDVKIKISRMAEVFKGIASNNYNADKLICMRRWGEGPHRDPRSKSYISRDVYPSSLYPDFCAGPVYMIPVTLAADFYEQALRTKFFKLEDVFLTGIVRNSLKTGIAPLNDMYCYCMNFHENWCVFCHG